MDQPAATSTNRWWRLGKSDRFAVAWMLVVPTLLFTLPALFGHAALAQDNLIQNFPLRVLTGRQLASGHLPLFNPLANSGTPLLGGMNAGSFFPLTFLFVFLPPLMAWVLNLIAVYAGAALGLFALLRWHRISTWPAAVAALVYAYSGAMMGQMVHLGVVQGFALLPWAVLALLAMARASRGLNTGLRTGLRANVHVLAPSVMGFSLLWALTTLSGEPRAIAEMELLTSIVVVAVLVVRSTYQPSSWRQRWRFVVGAFIGVVWGSMIGLAQLLPGWSFINISQRSSLTYEFFGTGSLPVRWTSLLLMPDLVGGNGFLHQPQFFVNYNLPEVTGYVGVLALVASAAFFSQLTLRGWRGGEREFVLYAVVLVTGLFAAWGSYTPLGHLFSAIPLFGSTRLQSRNIILVDLALSALLGWWLERLRSREVARAGLLGLRRWVTSSPAIAVLALGVVLLAIGPTLLGHLGASPSSAQLVHFQHVTILLHMGVAATVLGVLWRRVLSRRALAVLVGITALDLVWFLATCATSFTPGHVNVMPARTNAIAQLGSGGRFALVDNSGAHQNDFENLGAPNMNVFTGIASVQGYGSLINSLYGNVTATHPMFNLDPCQLANGTFIQLRLSAIAVSSDKLASALSLRSEAPLSCLAYEPTVTTTRYFGQMLVVRSILLAGASNRDVARGTVTAQLLDARGRRFGAMITEVGTPTLLFDFAKYHERAAGVLINAPDGALVSSAIVVGMEPQPTSYQLSSPFQQALSVGHWKMTSTVGTVSIYRAPSVRPSAWLGTNATTSRVVSIRDTNWGDSWVRINATHPTVMKRSMEWIPGWRATATNVETGRTVTLHVVRSGLIQQVLVSRGKWTVHFYYHAPHIELGLIGSSLSAITLALAALRRRPRRGTLRR